jgi:hypothetical protein
MIAVDVGLFVLGLVLVLWVLSSAIVTVVVPRGDSSVLSQALFVLSSRAFEAAAERTSSPRRSEAIRARFAPVTLMLLPATWALGIMTGFVPMYWAVGVRPFGETVVLTGSSLTTLGFSRPNEGPAVGLATVEGLLGLTIVALLISFLPTIYGHFSRREVEVAKLASRAGTPPTPSELVMRAGLISGLDRLDELWPEWERWFVELEESHTSYPSLVFFRSPSTERSWILAAGAVLDGAALRASTMDMPRCPDAELCIRAGYLALREVADFFGIDHDRHPRPADPISVHRAEFDGVYEQLRAAGVPLVADRDQAWKDWAGWRVNYDSVLLSLCALIQPPTAPWSSDRAPEHRTPTLRRRRRKTP